MEIEKEEIKEGRLYSLATSKKRALLIGIYYSTAKKPACEESLEELEELCNTYGLETVRKVLCPIKKLVAATFLGKGKLQEILTMCEEEKIDIVIFDEEISPHQQRNIEKDFKRTVIDRTELIIGVFSHHAQTKEARLQVELAQMRYQMPRLKRLWTHLERQKTGGGKGGHLKGAGETQIEIDRQLIKTRIFRLQKQLEEVIKHREVLRRARTRSLTPSFAIIGYTNVGKSTLLNALTDAGVLVEDKLFATLDITTRKYILPNNQEVTISDTVGFIKKIPHTLVAAFKSTLEESLFSDILMHVVDISHPSVRDQVKATQVVLKELKADDRPIITIFNKIDLLSDPAILQELREQYPKAIEVSALKKEGFEALLNQMIEEVKNLRSYIRLKVPQSEYAFVSKLMKEGNVISCEYEENDILLEAEIPVPLLKEAGPFIIADKEGC